MKTFYRLFLLSSLLTFPLDLQAAPTPPPVPDTTKAKPEDEIWFNKQAQIFYGNHIEYIKRIQTERKSVQQQLAVLNANKSAARDEAAKQKIAQEIKTLQDKLEGLNEDSAKHDLDTAEFGLIAAQHRLEAAKKNLARIQAQKKS